MPWTNPVTTDGRLFIAVRGLVFKDDPSVPPELRGKNDEENFRGAVSCLTESDETVPTVNVPLLMLTVRVALVEVVFMSM